MPDVKLIVLFATRNGTATLARVLEGYSRAEPPSVAWKMVIVNNGSTDGSANLIQSFTRLLPLELIDHPPPGKNRSLNRGLAAAEGELVVVTDDDAVPAPSLLKAWAKLLDARSEYEIFGGSIEPWFEKTPPQWMLKRRSHFDLLFAERDMPEGPINPEGVFGCNMAVRMSVFNRGFRFDENIGPNWVDENYPMGSETEFCQRAVRAGARCWFAREPHVRHIITSDDVTETNWAKRAYRLGRSMAILRYPSLSESVERPPTVATLSPQVRPASKSRRWQRMFYPAERRLDRIIACEIARGMADQQHYLNEAGTASAPKLSVGQPQTIQEYMDNLQDDSAAKAIPGNPDVTIGDLTLQSPLVSLVLVTRNRARFIGDMIDSIRRQDYRNFECLIVDNASTDDSGAAIDRHVGDDRRFTTIFLEQNIGQLGAFLHVFDRLRGEFVGIVDDDDILFPSFLSAHVQVHLALPNAVGFTSNNIVQIGADGSVLGGHTPFTSGAEFGAVGLKPIEAAPRVATVSDNFYRQLSARSATIPHGAQGWPWAPSAVLFRRSVMKIAYPESQGKTGPRGHDSYFKPFCHMLAGSAIIDLPLFARRIHDNNDFATMPSVSGLRYGLKETASREMETRFDILRTLLARARSFNWSLLGDRYWDIIDQHTLWTDHRIAYFALPEVTALFVEHYGGLTSVFGEPRVLRELRKRYRAADWLRLVRDAYAGNPPANTTVEMFRMESSRHAKRLRDRLRRDKTATAAPVDATRPPVTFGGTVLSRDPVIVLTYTGQNGDPLGLAGQFCEHFSARPATFLIMPPWTLEIEGKVATIHAAADHCRNRCSEQELIFLCNAQREVELYRQVGETPLLLNHNILVSELDFFPINETAMEFDAVYNGSLSPKKRHELAAMIPSVAYITYYHAGLGSKADVQARLDLLRFGTPGHKLINRVHDALPLYMLPRSINKVYGQAAVGLCLSQAEGAMYASMEYMLAGLPIVSTPSIGGRDHFFDPEYCLVVESDPRQIRDAVAALRSRAIPREYIRERTLAKLKVERTQFLELLDQILERRGAGRRFGTEWPFAARSRMIRWKTFAEHCADMVAG